MEVQTPQPLGLLAKMRQRQKFIEQNVLQARGQDEIQMSEKDRQELASSVLKCYKYEVMAQRLQNHVHFLNRMVDTQNDCSSEHQL